MVEEAKMGDKTYKELVVRFNEELAKIEFSHLEMLGFKEDPTIAVRYGIAVGYKMGVADARKLIDKKRNQPHPLGKEE